MANNDGERDVLDAFPLDATETTDTDGDGIGNVKDPDETIQMTFFHYYFKTSMAIWMMTPNTFHERHRTERPDLFDVRPNDATKRLYCLIGASPRDKR